MEAPIARKIHRSPKDFILKIPKSPKTNLYTFNQPSSAADSICQDNADGQNPNLETQLNPQPHNQPHDSPQLQQKVYFDAEEPYDKEHNQCDTHCENGEGNGRNQGNDGDGGYCSKLPQSAMGSLQSGTIVKQRILPTRSPSKTQKQFNRFGLSLLGIRRSKFSTPTNSQLQRKTSSSIQVFAHTRYHGYRDHQLYNDRTKSGFKEYAEPDANGDGEEVYRHSMYPFSVRKIQGIKRDVNQILGESRLKRSSINPLSSPKPTKPDPNPNQQFYPYPQLHHHPSQPIYKITIKTSLSSLKQLLSCPAVTPVIMVPHFFTHPPRELTLASPNPETLKIECSRIFGDLDIPVHGLHIRKYSNCVVVVNHDVCIIWHSATTCPSSKKYMGNWKNKYFNQGEKQGMGLEWSPGRYVYYGEFKANKRNGFGVMRKTDGNSVVGFWKQGKYVLFGLVKR